MPVLIFKKLFTRTQTWFQKICNHCPHFRYVSVIHSLSVWKELKLFIMKKSQSATFLKEQNVTSCRRKLIVSRPDCQIMTLWNLSISFPLKQVTFSYIHKPTSSIFCFMNTHSVYRLIVNWPFWKVYVHLCSILDTFIEIPFVHAQIWSNWAVPLEIVGDSVANSLRGRPTRHTEVLTMVEPFELVRNCKKFHDVTLWADWTGAKCELKDVCCRPKLL